MCVIRRKLKPDKIVIINLFHWIISLHSLSHMRIIHTHCLRTLTGYYIYIYIYIYVDL